MRNVLPEAEHQAFRDDVIKILSKHSGHLPATHMLALTAHLVGQIIAMQDKDTTTPDMAMEIVTANIELGNAEAMASMGPSNQLN